MKKTLSGCVRISSILSLIWLWSTLGCGGGGGAPPGPSPTNHPPVILSLTIQPQPVAPGASAFFTVIASDADRDPLSYKWEVTGGHFPDVQSNIWENAPATVRWIAPPSPNQQFQVTVTVTDPSGARDARSEVIFLATLSATIDSPQNNEPVRGTIPVRGRITGFQGRVNVQFFVDPDPVNPTPLQTFFANPDGSFSLIWDTTLVENGRHAIAIWARDETTGNTGATMTNVVVDNKPPEPSIYFISPRDNAVVTLSDQVLVVEVFATDTLSGLARVDFFRDFDQPLQCRNLNNSYQDTNPVDGWKCEWPVPTDTNLAGVHTLRVVAYDSSGNSLTTTTPRTFFLLNCGTLLPPVITPASGPTNWTEQNSPYFIQTNLEIRGGVTVNVGLNTRIKFFPGRNITVKEASTFNVTGAVFTSVSEGFCSTNAGVPQSGDWGQIRFEGGSSGRFINSHILYGGGAKPQMIEIVDSQVTIDNTFIAFSASNAVKIAGTSPLLQNTQITQSTFQRNRGAPIVMTPAFGNLSPNNTFQENSQNVIKVESGVITGGARVRWNKIPIPYYVEGIVLVGEQTGATESLEIADRNIVKFTEGSGIIVNGSLSANSVLFTSYRDDLRGGDSNGDGPSTGQKGDWTKIFFGPRSTGSLSSSEIFFGGGSGSAAVVEVLNGSPLIQGNMISQSASSGIRLSGSVGALNATVIGNNISAVDGYPMILPPFALPDPSNTFGAEVRFRGIAIVSGEITDRVSPMVWPTLQFPYVIQGDVRISAAGSLRIEPGTIIKFESTQGKITVFGTLDAQNVIFTSFRDDVGTDTNGDGNATLPAPGDWDRIQFQPGSGGRLKNSELRYGGGGQDPRAAALVLNGTHAEVEGNLISDSWTDGISLLGGPAALTTRLIGNRIVRSGSCRPGTPPQCSNRGFPIAMPPNYQGLDPSNLYQENRFPAILLNIQTSAIGQVGQTVNPATEEGIAKEIGPVIWKKYALPYVLDSSIILEEESYLRVEPGVVVKIWDRNPDDGNFIGFDIFGPAGIPPLPSGATFIADSLGGERIVFTSFRDDTVAGDTNADLDFSRPTPGEWRGFSIDGLDADVNVRLNGVDIKYAGLSESALARSNWYTRGAIFVTNSSPAIENTLIHASASNGIVVSRTSDPLRTNPILRSISFTRMGKFPLVVPITVFRPGNALEDNLNFFPSDPLLRNTFPAVAIYYGRVPASLGVLLLRAFHTGEQKVPYVLLGRILVEPQAELRIAEGVIIKFADTEHMLPVPSVEDPVLAAACPGPVILNCLIVDGLLTSLGTDPNRVVFTSFKDDAAGGDTNGDGGATLPERGDWGTIHIKTRITGILRHTEIRYGGGSMNAAIVFEGPNEFAALFTFEKSSVHHNLNNGIIGTNQFQLKISEVEVFENRNFNPAQPLNRAFWQGSGIVISNSPTRIEKTSVFLHPDWGIDVNTTTQVHLDAVHIYQNGIRNEGASTIAKFSTGGLRLTNGKILLTNSFRNPVFPHRVVDNVGNGILANNLQYFTVDDLEVRRNQVNGLFIIMTENITNFTQITDSVFSENFNDGIRIRNVVNGTGTSNPTIENVIAANNGGSGIHLFQTAPTVRKVSLVNNHKSGLVVDCVLNIDWFSTDEDPTDVPEWDPTNPPADWFNRQYLWNCSEATRINPNYRRQDLLDFGTAENPDWADRSTGNLTGITQFTRAWFLTSTPAIGDSAPFGPVPADCFEAFPLNSNYNCYKDNDPYQIEVPPHLSLNPGNYFQPVPSSNPRSKNAIRIYGGSIYNYNAESISPGNESTYTILAADATWQRFSLNAPYVLTDDLLIPRADMFGFPYLIDPANIQENLTRIILRTTAPVGGDPVVIKVTRPETVWFSGEVVDVHVHSVYDSTNTVWTSIKDDSVEGDTDLVADVPLPGDWGALIFYPWALDWYESLRSADYDSDEGPCAFVLVGEVDPEDCSGSPQRDEISELFDTKVFYGGGSRPGAIILLNHSLWIHGSQPTASRIGFSASNGIYANGQDRPFLYVFPLNSGGPAYNWDSWADILTLLRENTRPMVDNTLFLYNQNFACFHENGANENLYDGTENFAGSNSFTGNGHDCCFTEGLAGETCT